ncbi:MAG: acyltransferase domain-containing protein [Lachnospiraceae bacterium]
MTRQELYHAIALPKGAQEALEQLNIDKEQERVLCKKYDSNREEFYDRIGRMSKGPLMALDIYIELALRTYKDYKKRGISEEIYVNTFRDLTIWCKDYYKKFGEFGIQEYHWLSYAIDLRLFRLGRLQFEPIRLEQDIVFHTKVIEKGTKVLNVHIPEGEPLLKEKCNASFEMAKEFFGEDYQYAVCTTWLLAPLLDEILDETSNIHQFKQRFLIYDVNYAFPQIEQRVFGTIQSDKAGYPENNSLQKKVKLKVLEGVEFGMGCGICSLL